MNDLLKVDNVCKKYPSFALENVSFNVPEGAIVGFIGRNGAGKTTTLKGIMNLVHFDSGDVYCFDKNMKENELELKQKIGFTLSELAYYPNKTIKQVINVTSRFYNNFSKEKYEKLCKLFKLDENKKLEQLSSGMKVKFSLAIALSVDAKLLILDEPTSGLDPISRDEILDIFESIIQKEGRAILFSTHITSDLDKVATHIVYIKKGTIQFSGTKNDFVKNYLSFKCSLEAFKENDNIISYKKYSNHVEGLINRENKDLFKDYQIEEPDLEQIMVHLEKEGEENEKFDI